MSTRKPTRIKTWPELESYLPLLMRLPNKRSDPEHSVGIDFSRARKIEMTALSCFIMRVLRYLKEQKVTTRIVIEKPVHALPAKLLTASNFEFLINKYNPFPIDETVNDLFSEAPTNSLSPIEYGHLGANYVAFPLLYLPFSSNLDRREAVAQFEYQVHEWIAPIVKNRINLPQFLMVLKEISKNSADHIDGDAVFGMDIKLFDKHSFVLQFAYSDSGPGIHQGIWTRLAEQVKQTRERHKGISESYVYALRNGFSTKRGNGLNMGIGMSMIMEGAKKLGLDLSVFDAESRGLITEIKEATHKEVRRSFFVVSPNLGFTYYGRMVYGND